MQATRTDDGVRLGSEARQRFHDARGYGRAVEGELVLAPVEAAYLLYRGDLPGVDGLSFDAYLRAEANGILHRFIVYKDLRERGFYLRPDQDRLSVFERGSGPSDGDVAYRIRVVDERRPLAVASLTPGVLAIVDDEGEVGYVQIEETTISDDRGRGDFPFEPVDATVIGGRAVVWNPPDGLYRQAFFGQPLGGRDADGGPIQLSLVEAAYLLERDLLTVDLSTEALIARGVEREGEPFHRRLAAYRTLRDAGLVPKTGYKFGADFRLYHSFSSIEEMSHSEELIRVVDAREHLLPHAIALDVRLAHGVGKRMLFAITSGSDARSITWRSIARLTP